MFTRIRNRYHPLWRLRQKRWFRALQKRVDFPVTIKTGRVDCRVMLLRDFSLVVTKEGEAVTHSVFEKIITGLGVARLLDVGSNVGTFSWHAISLNPAIEIHLFEPDRTNVRLLKSTIARNRLGQARIWEGVLSESDTEVDFLVDEASGATGSIGAAPAKVSLQSEYGMSHPTKVRSTTLDHYLRELGATPSGPTLVKIDVEGAEGAVLRGGSTFLAQERPIVIVECFCRDNLEPLRATRYQEFPLTENSNYLFVPEEWVTICRSKGILPASPR